MLRARADLRDELAGLERKLAGGPHLSSLDDHARCRCGDRADLQVCRRRSGAVLVVAEDGAVGGADPVPAAIGRTRHRRPHHEGWRRRSAPRALPSRDCHAAQRTGDPGSGHGRRRSRGAAAPSGRWWPWHGGSASSFIGCGAPERASKARKRRARHDPDHAVRIPPTRGYARSRPGTRFRRRRGSDCRRPPRRVRM